MKIAIYTMTRDRLEYTKHCFGVLWAMVRGFPYEHFILDNGSTDGTPEWLTEHKDKFTNVTLSPDNMGISAGSNFLIDKILETDAELIIKMDNDCEIVTDSILRRVSDLYEKIGILGGGMVLSPRVEGIGRQPVREYMRSFNKCRVGMTAIVGGLFHIVPRFVYEMYRYPENLPKAWGQDDHFCAWVREHGGEVGYIEGMQVNHYETTAGQFSRYPEYFERKQQEEKK